MATKLTSSYQYIGRSNAVSCPAGYNYYILLYAKTSPNDTTGKHTVSVQQYIACSNDSTFYGFKTSGSVKVAGVTAFSWDNTKVPSSSWSSSSSITAGGVTYKRHTLLMEGSAVVSTGFGADTDVTVASSWVMNDSNSNRWFPYTGTYANANITVTLAGIAGASAPTLSASTVKMGDDLTITTNRLSSSFTHTLSYSFGTMSGTIATGVGASYTWKVPDLAAGCNNSTSGICTITCKTYNGSTSVGSESAQVTLTVPDATIPELSATSIDMGERLTISVENTRKSTNFTHTFTYSFTGESTTKTGTLATDITYSWTQSFNVSDFAPLIPTQTSGVLTIISTTYNGSAVVGAVSKNVTLNVPDTETTRPSFTYSLLPDIPNIAADGDMPEITGIYVRYKSSVIAIIDASSECSEIAEYKLTVDGGYVSSSTNATFESLTSKILQNGYGTLEVKVRVTDARGYYTEKVSNITVHNYSNPKVVKHATTGKLDVVRYSESAGAVSDTGTEIWIDAARQYTALTVDGVQLNRCYFQWSWKLTSDPDSNWSEWYSLIAVTDTSSNSFSGRKPYTLGSPTFEATKSYDVRIRVYDRLGSKDTFRTTIPTAEVAFHLGDGGKKAAFGKYAENENAVEIADEWDLILHGSAIADHIVARGVDEFGWNYMCFKSGVNIAWLNKEFENLEFTANGSIYRSQYIDLDPPPYLTTGTALSFNFTGYGSLKAVWFGQGIFGRTGAESKVSTRVYSAEATTQNVRVRCICIYT